MQYDIHSNQTTPELRTLRTYITYSVKRGKEEKQDWVSVVLFKLTIELKEASS